MHTIRRVLTRNLLHLRTVHILAFVAFDRLAFFLNVQMYGVFTFTPKIVTLTEVENDFVLCKLAMMGITDGSINSLVRMQRGSKYLSVNLGASERCASLQSPGVQ